MAAGLAAAGVVERLVGCSGVAGRSMTDSGAGLRAGTLRRAGFFAASFAARAFKISAVLRTLAFVSRIRRSSSPSYSICIPPGAFVQRARTALAQHELPQPDRPVKQ